MNYYDGLKIFAGNHFYKMGFGCVQAAAWFSFTLTCRHYYNAGIVGIDFKLLVNMELPGWPIQIQWLFTLAIPIACIAWTVTHEEVFKEPREFCIKWSKEGKTILKRKFFYLFTCEYCFSHYVTILMLCFTGYKLLLGDWRGYIIAGFSLVWVANFYMAVFSLLRFGIKKEKIDISTKEEELRHITH